jgi:hypothetical protein
MEPNHYGALMVLQLHSELVRTTILKDFVDFEGVSKYVVTSVS